MAKSKWYQLDNAAKIVPSTTGGADTRVFRITCELKEDVDPWRSRPGNFRISGAS